jgi:glycosyltransferase involved in cell wall biosynthesis
VNKRKVLVLSDHALSTSGVGTQTRHLLEGLIKKGSWTFRQFGAAIKHENYDVIAPDPDLIIKPIDGFGNRELIRKALAEIQPDAILIFTDPRFFYWLFEMEEEIHQVCPIAWWHVWDNNPDPSFNMRFYEATDLINCHSYLTYEICKKYFPEKTNFIPHALPQNMFFPLEKSVITSYKEKLLGSEKKDWFVTFWANRNAKRKRPSDVLWAWKLFLDKIKKDHNRDDAIFVMHTEPLDPEGPNLLEVVKHLGIERNVIFSKERIKFEEMNILHNISDVYMNISYAEGFGLGTLEAMQCGKPIIAAKTGGLTRQVVDHRDGSENGVALPITLKTLVGSQQVPYIYEDYASVESAAEAIYKIWSMSQEERDLLGQKVRSYALSQFNYQDTIDAWDKTLGDLVENYKKNKSSRWSIETI